ncbi:MAG: hypothetical protein ACFB10_05330 [Salibacteraceae bacterium]
MKFLKSFFTVTFLCAGLMLTQQSCDDCNNVDCQNGGTCDAGDCSCPTGFTGDECETDLCASVTCLNGGVTAPIATDCGCDCSAATGYEGDDCNTEMRAKFIGTYTVAESCGANSATFAVTNTNSASDITRILMSDFADVFNSPVVITVDGNNLTIPDQEPDGDGFRLTGTGTTTDNGSTFNLSYTVNNTNNNTTFNCTAVFTKQ